MRRTVSALALALSLSLGSQAFANPLAHELQYLLENYPSIQAKSSLSDAAREEISAAQGLKLPSLDFNGDTGFQRNDNPGKNDWRVKGNLTATYNLFDGNYSVFEEQSATVAHKSTLAELDSTKQRILFQGIQAYLNLVLQNKLVDIAQTNVKLVEQIKTFIDAESSSGRMSQADLLQARARLAQAREALTAYQGSQRQGQNRYFHLYQRVPTAGRMNDPLAPSEITPESLEEAIRLARKHNPTLNSAKMLVEAASSKVGTTQSALYPRVDLEGSGDANYNVDGVDGMGTEGTVLLKMSWNLFDGNRTNSKTRAAALRHNAAMMDLRHKNLLVEEQVRNAFSVIETEKRRFRTLQEAESIAQEAFNARYDMMQSGKETIITVLDTALELLNVRIAVTSSDYAHRLANYQLLLATGQLNQNSISRLVVEGKLQPAVKDDGQIIQKLIDGEAMQKNDMPPREIAAPNPGNMPLDLGGGVSSGYNDMAAFEAAHGAPYSDELAPETELLDDLPIELGPITGDGYYLILGSFSEPAYATDRITLAGMENAFLRDVNVNGTTYSRVMVGPMSQSDAEQARLKARDRGIPDSWILLEE